MKLDKAITLKDIEYVLPLKTWYASIFVLPIAKILILFFSKRKILTPNQITLIAFLFRIITAIMFLQRYFIWGSIFYYLAYVLDCVDGSVARLTNKTSNFGRYLDHVSDLTGDIVVLISLAYSVGIPFKPLVLAMMFMHITENFISYLAGFALKSKDEALDNFVLFRIFNTYRKWWFNKNFKSFLSFPDYTAFVFIVMPILGMPQKGLFVGFYLLFIIVSYTIFSIFVSLHTKENRFP